MAKDFIKFNGMSFNKSVLAKKTKEEFIEHEKHNFQTENGPADMDKLWELMQKKPEPVKEVAMPAIENSPAPPAKAVK